MSFETVEVDAGAGAAIVEVEADTPARVVEVIADGGPPGPQGEPGTWLRLTQAEFDALVNPDPNTLYVIVG